MARSGQAPGAVIVAANRARVSASSTDPPAIGNLQDEALRRLAGTGVHVVRRFATVPLLALAIDAAALARLEAKRDIVVRVRADRIMPLHEDRPLLR